MPKYGTGELLSGSFESSYVVLECSVFYADKMESPGNTVGGDNEKGHTIFSVL